jgi:hypothetical protein
VNIPRERENWQRVWNIVLDFFWKRKTVTFLRLFTFFSEDK